MSPFTRAVSVLKRPVFLSSRSFHVTAQKRLALDKTQEGLLDEQIILVDEYDCIKGYETKRECHLKANIIEHGMLHRAFSVFLFNQKGDLLMQKRSNAKITFPGYITNSCCSHPLHSNESEVEEYENIGVKRAAKRRLSYELGIPENQISLQDLKFLTRIHYKAGFDKTWGEHEIDYVLFMQKDVALEPNANEVQDCWYASESQVKQLLEKAGHNQRVLVTPWFKMIGQNLLFQWWASLNDLSQYENDSRIHKMSGVSGV